MTSDLHTTIAVAQALEANEKGDFEGAVRMIEQDAERVPGDAELPAVLGRLHHLHHRPEEAFRYCCRALRMDPFNDTAFATLNEVLSQLRNGERADIFEGIYQRQGWGRTGDQEYFSGSGSRDANTEIYRTYVGDFIAARDIKSVVDLGCGDFTVSGHTDLHGAAYTGVDIFDDLVRLNNQRFGNDSRRFVAADMVEDPLPEGDLRLLRQALQHLSNGDIEKVLGKLEQFDFVLITDGQAGTPPFRRRNIDKLTGISTRCIDYNNGLYLELPPFNIDVEVVLEYAIDDSQPPGEILRTVLIDNSN